jgi:outer membrane protein OmpA-like peptidoglycan-associated protein
MRASLLSLLLLVACKVSLSTSVGSPGADAKLSASADANTAALPGATRIVRSGNKLDYEGGEIEFETAKATLRGRTTENVLDRLAEVLQKIPELQVRIEARTDSRGSREYNRKLSDERAAAIKTALIKRGVADTRLSSAGKGEDDPTQDEPAACKNKPEDSVAAAKRDECNRIWAINRRAAFIVTSGAEALPPEGSAVTGDPAEATPPTVAKSDERRPDWALRFFGGYTLLAPGVLYHGGHFGVGLHASQRFGERQRGYIGGGPRLHYRGVRNPSANGTPGAVGGSSFHEFGPEGDLLLGGGSARVVGLFSLRVGLGLGAFRDGVSDSNFFTGWALGGLVVLAKVAPRWSVGGHAEAGITNMVGIDPVAEVGINVAWHFGKGRRKGI